MKNQLLKKWIKQFMLRRLIYSVWVCHCVTGQGHSNGKYERCVVTIYWSSAQQQYSGPF